MPAAKRPGEFLPYEGPRQGKAGTANGRTAQFVPRTPLPCARPANRPPAFRGRWRGRAELTSDGQASAMHAMHAGVACAKPMRRPCGCARRGTASRMRPHKFDRRIKIGSRGQSTAADREAAERASPRAGSRGSSRPLEIDARQDALRRPRSSRRQDHEQA